MKLLVFDPQEDRKKTLVTLQLLLVLATSYFLLFKKGNVVQDPWSLSLILILLVSALVLHRLPRSALEHRLFSLGLVAVDTLLVTVAIGLNRENSWDLLLLFFFGLFIVAMGESLAKIVAVFVLASVISVVMSSVSLSRLDSDLLFRVPFLFGVSLLYGYLSVEAKKERRRAERAEETERISGQLVSALAHDVQNPLGVMMGYAEVAALSLKAGRADERGLDAIQRVQENAARVVKLVAGFLDARKVEAGKFDGAMAPLQLNGLIRGAGEQQMVELRKRGIELRLYLEDHLPEICGDAAQLDRVLWNLIGNAIKFTPPGGTVTLKSGVKNEEVLVSVSDTGMGIPTEELPLLFKEFRRLKGAVHVAGTGLGLFIVKTIVQAHGGRVEAESVVGQGSTFTVRFPHPSLIGGQKTARRGKAWQRKS